MNIRGVILSVIFLSGAAVLFFSVTKEGTEREKPKATVGLDAPQLVLNNADGSIYNQSVLNGSVVFINFWASWCQPCREEMPSIQELYNHFKGNKQFHMLTILYNEDYQKAVRYMKENNFQFPVLVDSDGKTARSYGVTGIPETYIVDKKGILKRRIIGPEDWNSPQVKSFLSKLIQE